MTYEELASHYSYNPDTGDLFRRDLGRKVKTRDAYGYVVTCITKDKKQFCYKAHRLAWLLYYGEWPHGVIDHKNQIVDDNRIENLRDVCKSKNAFNSKVRVDNCSGLTGVSFRKDKGKWRAYINVDGKQLSLGLFNEKTDAIAARRLAEQKYYPIS